MKRNRIKLLLTIVLTSGMAYAMKSAPSKEKKLACGTHYARTTSMPRTRDSKNSQTLSIFMPRM
jgi:hypothetical protein